MRPRSLPAAAFVLVLLGCLLTAQSKRSITETDLFQFTWIKESPGTAGDSCSCNRVAAYRLAWRLTPPPGPLAGPLPRMSPVETSLTHSEPLPL